MAKIRVGQLAKELHLKVGDLIALLRTQGVDARTNLSMVEEAVADRVRATRPQQPPAAPAASPAKAVTMASKAPATAGVSSRRTLKAPAGAAQLRAPAEKAEPSRPRPLARPASAANPPAAAHPLARVAPRPSAPAGPATRPTTP